jgi:hypothetical protein
MPTMSPRTPLALASLALLLATASAAVTPDAKAAVLPVDKAVAADVAKALAAPGVLVVTTWKLDPATDADKWIATRQGGLPRPRAGCQRCSAPSTFRGIRSGRPRRRWCPGGDALTPRWRRTCACYTAAVGPNVITQPFLACFSIDSRGGCGQEGGRQHQRPLLQGLC